MLPGYVAGRYSYDDCHIDLAVLAAAVGARLVVGTATGIDTTVIPISTCQRIDCGFALVPGQKSANLSTRRIMVCDTQSQRSG